jgi:hypothetical protein
MSLYQRDPAAPGANVGRRRARSDEFEAIARFNASDAGRTAAGLTRSLGQPKVSIGAVAGSHSAVRITVAWELCWYQWGVDLGNPRRPVFEIAKGTEVDQLDHSARQWNGQASWLRLKRR